MLDLKGNGITYFGHSTFSIAKSSSQVAVIDPWVMTNPRCPESLKKMFVPRYGAGSLAPLRIQPSRAGLTFAAPSALVAGCLATKLTGRNCAQRMPGSRGVPQGAA
jgi:hypothetical protein